MLIQDYSLENSQQVIYWKKNGLLVKKTDLKNIRLMVYDSKSLYLMSYAHADSVKDLGVKIGYPPFAAIISKLFSQWWQEAKVIRSA